MSTHPSPSPDEHPATPGDPSDGASQPPLPEPKSIAAMRRIVAEGQYRRISGVLIDASTANVVLVVFDGLSPRLREKFAAMPVALMARTAWQLVSRSGS